jgi:hypothetical protein
MHCPVVLENVGFVVKKLLFVITCRIMQKQMGWNTYVHIVALQISRRNRRKLEMDFPQG